ncbi:MAG: hypothetical protein PUG48_10725 [Clostridia bacterium]|nr:hypothetical protein [Clostridia bacterium]
MTESEFQEFIITVGYRYCEKAKTAFNSFEGFHTRIQFSEKEKRYSLVLSAITNNSNDAIDVQNMLKEFSSEHKNYITKAIYSDKKISINLKMTIDSAIDKNELKEIAKFITELCKSGKIIPVCSVCFRNKKTGLYIVGRELMPMCDFCVERKRQRYEHRKNLFDKKTQNMPAGIAGAVFGALLGAALYVLLYQLLFVFGIGSLFIIVLSFVGFVVTGQRATKKSAVVCEIISAVVFLIAEYVALVANMSILIEQKGGGIAVSEAIQAINMSFMDMSFLVAAGFDILTGFAVMAIAGLVYFLKRKYTRPLKISKNIL